MTDGNYLGNFWGNQSGFVEQVSTPLILAVTVTPGVASIALAWSAVTGALYYVVYCGLAPESLVLQTDDLQTPGFTIASLTTGVRYFVQVLAVFSTSASMASAVGSATPV